MGPNLERLLSVAGAALRDQSVEFSPMVAALAGAHAADLQSMLTARNGFYAFESALHVFPAGHPARGYALDDWNAPELWRERFGPSIEGSLFFAEDVFSEQFAIHQGRIQVFHPESGEFEDLAGSLDEWAGLILDDYSVLTGYESARMWQAAHGSLGPVDRLLPKTPFVLGGEYDLSNLYAGDPVEVMKFRADLANQIRDLPDGAEVEIRLDNDGDHA